ncbi:MAG: hypothetical protein D6701_06560 [Gemmatimonadetes bacterium]|nr:MAG: hypothetical protein D6701_06560 [Gemmatimonadota bacterium]
MIETTARRGGRPFGSAPAGLVLVALGVCAGAFPLRTAAQEERDSIPGVTLGLVYETESRPALAVMPFQAEPGLEDLAERVGAIVARDLRYSDRFEILDSLPQALAGTVDYQLWDQLGAVWLVTGRLEPDGDRVRLVLQLHDVVFGEIHEQRRYPLLSEDHPDFRMSVHVASDDVVESVTGDPGIAATRIAFSRRSLDGQTQDLFVIDSDGENLRRLTRHNTISLGPDWSPDGTRLVYTSFRPSIEEGRWGIFEIDLRSGEEREIRPNRAGQLGTPVYTPDGRRLAFSVRGSGRTGIFTYDLARDCCLQHVTGGNWEDLSPTFSPDGRWMAFNSSRLGTATPQIFVMPARGGEPDLVSPYLAGHRGYYTSPDWSPRGDLLAFHGRTGRFGRYQILVGDVSGEVGRLRRLTQLTWEGNNEDPSWAPDGRHLVFIGRRDWGTGLMIVDSATGEIRMLLRGVDVRVPDWSPPLRPEPRETLREGGF